MAGTGGSRPRTRGASAPARPPATTGAHPAERGAGRRGERILRAASAPLPAQRPPHPPPPPSGSGNGCRYRRPLTLCASAATASHCQPRASTTHPPIGPLRPPASPAPIGRYLLWVSASAPQRGCLPGAARCAGPGRLEARREQRRARCGPPVLAGAAGGTGTEAARNPRGWPRFL